MDLHFKGMVIAISTFLIIGVFHPIVIKVEYYFGTRPWWLFLVAGIASIGAAFLLPTCLYRRFSASLVLHVSGQ